MEQPGILVKKIMRDFQHELAGIYPEREISQFVYILFDAFMGWEKTRVHLSFDTEVPGLPGQLFYGALNELAAGKPIQYITGRCRFDDLLLKVAPGVLIPRPETEELCATIRKDLLADGHPSLSILDIGTGSGCIAIYLKKHFPHAVVAAMEHSSDALAIARTNALANNCEISFENSNILHQRSREDGVMFNVIVSNPPYVLESERKHMHRNVTDFEPGMALFVPDQDPLVFYRAVTEYAANNIIPPARLYFEINERFGREVRDLVLSAGFDEASVLSDFHGKDRFVSARWLH